MLHHSLSRGSNYDFLPHLKTLKNAYILALKALRLFLKTGHIPHLPSLITNSPYQIQKYFQQQVYIKKQEFKNTKLNSTSHCIDFLLQQMDKVQLTEDAKMPNVLQKFTIVNLKLYPLRN